MDVSGWLFVAFLVVILVLIIRHGTTGEPGGYDGGAGGGDPIGGDSGGGDGGGGD